MEALGKRLETEVEDAGGAAAVEIDGTDVVLQDAGELLLVRAVIGEIPADAREKVLSVAMESNYLYQGTGGSTLAVNPSDGRLHMHMYNWMERLDVARVLDLIGKFASSAAAWRRILAECGRDEPSGAGAKPADGGAGDFMRV